MTSLSSGVGINAPNALLVVISGGGVWILLTGFWNDAGVWDDASSWID